MCAGVHEGQESTLDPGVGATGNCEPPDKDLNSGPLQEFLTS